MENKTKRLYEELEKVKQRYLLAERVNIYTSYARHTDLELEKEAKQSGIYLDLQISEQFAHIGGQLSSLLTAIAIVEGRYD